MRIAVVGPGRAGTAVCLAARRAGHDVVAVAARSQTEALRAAQELAADPVEIGRVLPGCDLVIVAVPDIAIAAVAEIVAPTVPAGAGAVHLSGATTVAALGSIASLGIPTGSFHPLQTLPNPEMGARRMAGSWIAITADEPLRSDLGALARSMAANPFDLAEDAKALYHAAAVAASNFPVAALAVAEELFEQAGVPFHAARPLAEAAVANAFELGSGPALTGPIARGDADTVERQRGAVTNRAPDWVGSAFGHFVAATESVVHWLRRGSQ